MRLTYVLAAAIATVVIAGCATPPEPEPSAATGPAVEDGPDHGWMLRSAPPLPAFELVEPFVKLVDFSRLRVGMTKEEVRAIFPDPLEVKLQRDDEVWYYGFAQLIFRGNYLNDWFNM